MEKRENTAEKLRISLEIVSLLVWFSEISKKKILMNEKLFVDFFGKFLVLEKK